MTEVTESTIRFPYKRSLGPVIGAFLTGLSEQRILGIRSGERVLCPPLEWDPETGAELVHDELVEVGPAGTVTAVELGGHPDRAAPARPSLRVRADPARRRRHDAGARGRCRVDRGDGHGDAGGAPVG